MSGECPECRGLGFLRAGVPVGHPDFGKFIPCHCKANEYQARKIARLSKISGLLPEEMAITINDAALRGSDTDKMVTVARQFVAEPGGFLTLWGGYGNGKTLVLMAIVNELREKRGLVGAYVRFVDLINYVRAGMDTKIGGDRERYDYLKTVDVLAIDEVDKARMTDYAYEFRTAFLDDRYRLATTRRAHTILAMNTNPADSDFPRDIYDRLRDGRFTIFHNADSSMRPVMEW